MAVGGRTHNQKLSREHFIVRMQVHGTSQENATVERFFRFILTYKDCSCKGQNILDGKSYRKRLIGK
jgi:hypothetical protein